MALDPVFKALLESPEMQFGRPPEGVTPPMMREFAKATRPDLPAPAVHEVRNLTCAGPDGEIGLRLYHPTATRPAPVILFFHGGGFVLCDLDSHDLICRGLALASGCAVVSVDYRLAPETRFPGPVEDCYTALEFVAKEGAGLGLDPTRIAVCGDSAGGSLAIATALLARDRKGPAIRHQALLYPVTDAVCNRPSMIDYASGYMLSRSVMEWFWECFLEHPSHGDDPLASPVRTANLQGMPPATVITAEYDVLRDQGEEYADRLRAAGVAVVSRRYLGMIHGFATMPHVTGIADRAIADVALDIRHALGGSADGVEAENIARAQRLYAAAMTADWATVEALVAPACRIEESSGLPFAGVYVGPQGLQDLFIKLGGMVTILDVRLQPMIAKGDTVMVSIDLVLDDGGQPAHIPVVEVLRFENGQVVELTPYYFDTNKVTAIAAARG
ncbi:MAG: alpha/beta hydrolase fold domain-containing protein [Steroidobacteraceae bacterium]